MYRVTCLIFIMKSILIFFHEIIKCFCFFSKTKAEEKAKPMKKYTVKPPKDLRSKFILKMEARKVQEEQDKEDKRKDEEYQKILVSEK